MGLLHIYHGDGKGKTTAAVGLACRAIATGKAVLFQQYLKDGKSLELTSLLTLGVEVESGMPDGLQGFTWTMNEAELAQLRIAQDTRLQAAVDWFGQHPDSQLIVLDEILASVRYGWADSKILLQFIEMIQSCKTGPDLVLTGREPLPELLELADYISEIQSVKHPYDQGIQARLGIEF